MGAAAAGADADQCRALEAYAYGIGLVFQIVDDVLDVTSTPEQLGKPVQDKEPAPTLSQKLTGTLDSLLFGKNESAAEPDAAVSNQKK